jgi:hypothetical protein
MKDVDPSGLGGEKSTSDLTFETVKQWSSALQKTVQSLEDCDGRTDDVLSFFTDYAETLIQISKVIKPGKPVAIVVGNRTVSDIPIPTHLISTELALEFGLQHKHTLPRSIPSKTLPSRNAPEGTQGQTGETIADEYILIFEGQNGPENALINT